MCRIEPGELAPTRNPRTRATALIAVVHPLGVRDRAGNDLYSLEVVMTVDGRREHRVLASRVPPAARPLLVAGATVPVTLVGAPDADDVTIDWPAALADAEAR